MAPALCLADGGLIGIVVFGYFYLFLVETLAVGVEAYILKRWYDARLKRALPWLLVGNFISTVVGLGLPMQMAFDAYKSHGHSGFGSPLLNGFMYNVFPILYLTALSILIEWPFIAIALKRKWLSWSTFKASLICNLISPVAVIGVIAILGLLLSL
jgi:hypothetical protein